MEQTLRQSTRIVGAIAAAAACLVTLLLILQTDSPSQAAFSKSISYGSNMRNDVFPERGAYHGAVIHLEQIDSFECMVSKELQVIKVYQFFKDGGFYEDWADQIHHQGAIEFLSFDPIISETATVTCSGETQSVSRTLHPDEVTSGAYDGVIDQFASQIRAWENPLILSFAGEMNGCWCPPVNWQGCYNLPNGPEDYIRMYRHVHDRFSQAGADNVIWAWVVNHESYPDQEWNRVDNYYPGDSYVDIISVNGYNWGDGGPGGWKTFSQVFSASVTCLSNTYPTKPLVLGEFASVEGTHPMSKANWITDAYDRIKTNWPQIKAVIWFNFPGQENFPVQSSPESIVAYSEVIADSYFIGDHAYCSYLPAVLKDYSN